MTAGAVFLSLAPRFPFGPYTESMKARARRLDRCARWAGSRLALAAFMMACLPLARGQTLSRSEHAAEAAIQRWPVPDPGASPNEQTGLAVLLAGMEAEWQGTANGRYFNYVKAAADARVAPDGGVTGEMGRITSVDNIALGRALLMLYRVTRDDRYYQRVLILRRQLAARPHSGDGAFQWSSNGDGPIGAEDLYAAAPFYAEYASAFKQSQDFGDIANQFALFDARARDARTGLYTKARDRMELAGQPERGPLRLPADEVGATAWVMMTLVDTLPWFPRGDPGRATLLAVLRRTAQAASRAGILKPGPSEHEHSSLQSGDSSESGAACMLVYSLAKAARLGYLPASYAAAAAGLYREFSRSSGPSWAGSDQLSAGALLLAAREMEVMPLARLGRGKSVMMDAWFNSQKRVNAAGRMESFHYKWDDSSDSGFSTFGHLFNDYGMETDTLDQAPSAANLAAAQFYIIASPDIPAKNPAPHYMSPKDAEQIAAWVRRGGVLLLMENDPANADIDHLNLLADIFRLHFNPVLSHHVIGDSFSMGRIEAAEGGPLFKHPHLLYMKDTCTIAPKGKARALLTDRGDVMMAAAKYGKGTVFAVVDPWVYNEYADGRKLPPEFDNLQGARELVAWLLRQLPPASADRRHASQAGVAAPR
jgi:unsaturated rhamnogalacturonyl hydrolase